MGVFDEMERIYIKKTDLPKTSVELEYLLIKSSRDSDLLCKGKYVFSLLCISIEKEKISGGDFLYDISSDQNTADLIFKIISDGGVSPITLKDVVCDLLAEGEG
ncbi:MAG: hypothetical protein IJO00_03220 [Clostridia bacterium]|nr:hypothetical protein [Clostridia bacterium]